MERIKTELLMIVKQKGDTGTTAQQRQWIDYYVEALDQFLRPEGIKAFTAEQLRDPYVEFVKGFLATGDLEEASKDVVLFFHTQRHMRDRPAADVSSGSVVDIFSPRS
ncbi:hypothetical protein HOV23_gp055 [Pseudomonas phage Lana]|uniref:Uncharacterized protein n=1 Tax=Pseudomonas phage Lana TaxID=2530172 RepID=A0A481W7A2_9CAUD|nr:hypothetical protein HOV23_gp055 [Pseudomonas phage Lana]QBJ04518.1 hypothetical protein [Pseudomonas phage Lana]